MKFQFSLLLLLIPALLFPQNKEKSLYKPLSPSSNEQFAALDTNRLKVIFKNNGSLEDPTGNWAYEYPKNSGKHLMFNQGFAISGYVDDVLSTAWITPAFRVLEWQPGNFTNSSPADPDHPKFKVYKLNRGDSWLTNPDIKNWPVDLGAPWIDADNNGLYQPEKGDKPGILGDQMIWYVINDNFSDERYRLNGSKPMNLEMQVKAFSFNRKGSLGETIFIEYKLINKNPKPITDAIFSVWSDPDLGSSAGDLVGCDTTRFMAYVYKEINNDRIYGTNPPAAGYAFVSGPVINSGNKFDSSLVNGQMKKGFRNSKLKSFKSFVINRGMDPDPSTTEMGRFYQSGLNFDGTEVFYWTGIGRVPTDNPHLQYCGYPELNTGWRDNAGGDRRMILNSEPFTMQPGDTQTILIACLAAQGTDHLNSIAELRKAADVARSAVPEIYKQPVALPAPAPVEQTLSSDGSIQFSFQTAATAGFTKESALGNVLNFKGYRLRQYETISGSWDEVKNPVFKNVKVLDVQDGFDRICSYINYDLIPDSLFFSVEKISAEDLAAYLSPAGRLTFSLSEDAFTGFRFVEGSVYEFGLTALYLDTLGLRTLLDGKGRFIGWTGEEPIHESEEIRIQVVYHGKIEQPTPSVSQESSPFVQRVSGEGKPVIQLQVTNQRKIRDGKNYPVEFLYPNWSGDLSWRLRDGMTGPVVLDSVKWFSDVFTQTPVDGFTVRIQLPQTKIISQTETGGSKWWSLSPQRTLTGLAPVDQKADTDSGGTRIWISDYPTVYKRYVSSVRQQEMRMLDIEFTKTNPSLAYRYISGVKPVPKAQVPPVYQPSTIKQTSAEDMILWAGFTKQNVTDSPANGRLRASRKPGVGIIPLPFRIWAVESDGREERRRQLKIGLVETYANLFNADQDVNGLWDADAFAQESILISSETYNPDLKMPADSFSLDPYMNFLVKNGKIAAPWMVFWEPVGDTLQWKENLISRVKFNLPTHEDKFVISGLQSDSAWYQQEKKNILNAVTVFPNPYLGDNPQELNPGERFVTILNLPETVTIRIYNLGGELVTKIEKDDRQNFVRWDLTNGHRFFVASGMYLVHIEAPGVGSKVLKLAVIQREW